MIDRIVGGNLMGKGKRDEEGCRGEREGGKVCADGGRREI